MSKKLDFVACLVSYSSLTVFRTKNVRSYLNRSFKDEQNCNFKEMFITDLIFKKYQIIFSKKKKIISMSHKLFIYDWSDFSISLILLSKSIDIPYYRNI